MVMNKQAAALPAPGTRMRALDFLALPESSVRIELIDGEVVYPFGTGANEPVSPAPEIIHQITAGKLYGLVTRVMPDGLALFAPVDFHVNDGTVLQPDVFWLAADTTCVLVEGKYYLGVPDLAIEILSPGTARYDKREKFRLYQQYGTREYWLVDPIYQLIEVYVREGDAFRLMGVYGAEDSFDSPLLGGRRVMVSEIF